MGAPTAEELVVLAKFREVVKGLDLNLNERQNTDMDLLRWLRARELNIPKATEMMKKSFEWRKEENIDAVLSWIAPETYAKLFPYEVCGRCKDNSPVLVLPFGSWDVRTEVEGGGKTNWLRHIDQMFARTFEEMYKVNDAREPGSKQLQITSCAIVLDFTGYGIRQLTSLQSQRTVMECVSRFESNYPETLKKLFVINAPWAFTLIFNIVKPLITARTLAKVEIHGHNPSKWQPPILDYISQDQIPSYLGGTKLNCCKFFDDRE